MLLFQRQKTEDRRQNHVQVQVRRYNARMHLSLRAFAIAAVLVVCGAVGITGQTGWTIPPNAADEKSPLDGSDKVLKKGKSLFGNRCQHCHGPEGKGDGPDADPSYMSDMDLTSLDNPDGVIFYKVWNGRKQPKMPAFKTELTRDEVWALVEYVKTLGKGGIIHH